MYDNIMLLSPSVDIDLTENFLDAPVNKWCKVDWSEKYQKENYF